MSIEKSFIRIFVLAGLVGNANAAWEYATKKDVMEDTTTYFAISRTITPLYLNSPYGGGQRPMLRHFITARNKDRVIEENHLVLSLERGQFFCYMSGVGDMCSVNVKINNNQAFKISASLNTYGGKRSELVLEVSEEQLSAILNAKHLLIQADFYGEGAPHIMEFNTSGYDVEKHLRIKVKKG